jgi:hypothetical protein
MSTENREKPQIFVDEDWKSQVEAEKKAAVAQSGEKRPGADSTQPTTTSSTETADQPRVGRLPPATLSFLITTLATQAMVSLGEVPDPFSGKAEVRLPEARHFIDSLAMLEEKTAGNRTPEESALLDASLHQLRMAFVEGQTGAATGK